MDITRVIIRPILTEKSYALNSRDPKQYVFVVDPKANKNHIIDAFVALYEFTPLKVNTQIRKPAKVRTGTLHPGYSKLTKIAYITLPPGKEINTSSEATTEQKQEVKKPKVDTSAAKAKGSLKEVSTAKNLN